MNHLILDIGSHIWELKLLVCLKQIVIISVFWLVGKNTALKCSENTSVPHFDWKYVLNMVVNWYWFLPQPSIFKNVQKMTIMLLSWDYLCFILGKEHHQLKNWDQIRTNRDVPSIMVNPGSISDLTSSSLVGETNSVNTRRWISMIQLGSNKKKSR